MVLEHLSVAEKNTADTATQFIAVCAPIAEQCTGIFVMIFYQQNVVVFKKKNLEQKETFELHRLIASR